MHRPLTNIVNCYQRNTSREARKVVNDGFRLMSENFLLSNQTFTLRAAISYVRLELDFDIEIFM